MSRRKYISAALARHLNFKNKRRRPKAGIHLLAHSNGTACVVENTEASKATLPERRRGKSARAIQLIWLQIVGINHLPPPCRILGGGACRPSYHRRGGDFTFLSRISALGAHNAVNRTWARLNQETRAIIPAVTSAIARYRNHLQSKTRRGASSGWC